MIAHIRQDKTEQSLEEHLIRTARIGSESAQSIGLSKTMYLTGILHDMGKNTKVFDEYIYNSFSNKHSVRRGEVNHSSAGGRFIFEYSIGKENSFRFMSQLISCSIVSHHGSIDCITIDGIEKFLKRLYPEYDTHYKEAKENSLRIFSETSVKQLMQESDQEIREMLGKIGRIDSEMGKSCEGRNFLLGCLQRLILSMLIDADWKDTADFMNPESEKRADRSKRDWIIFWAGLEKKVQERLTGFRGEDRISLLRKRMSAECEAFAIMPTGIYCLPIPTGGGKTLSSLRYALRHAREKNKKKILYIAPYLSILEQNAKEIRDTLQAEEEILEHHSNIVNSDFDTQEGERYRLLTQSWNSPIILTTMVQFLEVLFKSRSQNIRRFHQLKDSVIIIDEIQWLPIRCVHMFNTMLNFLSHCCNATIVLCSATQPLLGMVEKKILYGTPQNIIGNIPEISHAFKRVEIKEAIVSGGYDTCELADFILGKIKRNMLVILNTKSGVKRLYEELKGRISDDMELIQLTTYMCAEHRSDKIREMKQKMKEKRVLCISTQLIEAGVDISFEQVIRSMAGLDSIIQAAGRCNRNGERKLGVVFIICYKEEYLGSLKDIKEAQNAAQTLLDRFHNRPEVYEHDLMSQAAVRDYYEQYFFNRRQEMNGTLEKEGTTLYKLLADNPQGVAAYLDRSKDKKAAELFFKQAFKHAGDLFEVIGSDTIGLIVPYKTGMDSVEKIQRALDIHEVKRELKKLQRFTVNLYRNDKMLKELCQRGAVTNLLGEGIYVLSKEFYKDEEGISERLGAIIF